MALPGVWHTKGPKDAIHSISVDSLNITSFSIPCRHWRMPGTAFHLSCRREVSKHPGLVPLPVPSRLQEESYHAEMPGYAANVFLSIFDISMRVENFVTAYINLADRKHWYRFYIGWEKSKRRTTKGMNQIRLWIVRFFCSERRANAQNVS